MRYAQRKPLQLLLFKEDTVTVQWAAEYIGVSESTVIRYLEEGLLRGYRRTPRGWWNILKFSVLEFEQELRRGME